MMISEEYAQKRSLLARLLGLQEMVFNSGDWVRTGLGDVGRIMNGHVWYDKMFVYVEYQDGTGEWFNLQDVRHA